MCLSGVKDQTEEVHLSTLIPNSRFTVHSVDPVPSTLVYTVELKEKGVDGRLTSRDHLDLLHVGGLPSSDPGT